MFVGFVSFDFFDPFFEAEVFEEFEEVFHVVFALEVEFEFLFDDDFFCPEVS